MTMIDAKVEPTPLEDSKSTSFEFILALENLFYFAFDVFWMSYAIFTFVIEIFHSLLEFKLYHRFISVI